MNIGCLCIIKIKEILHRLKDWDTLILIGLLTFLIYLMGLLYGKLSASAYEAHSEKGRRYILNQKDVSLQEISFQNININVEKQRYISEFELILGGTLQIDYRYYEEDCREDNRFDI